MNHNEIKSAVLLLAGRGKRLRELTDDIPKCLVPVCGRPILHRMLDNLSGIGISRILLVVGYLQERIRQSVGNRWKGMDIEYVYNDQWDKANNIISLYCAADWIDSPFLLIEGDIVVSPDGLQRMLERNVLAVDRYNDFMEGTVVSVGPDNVVQGMYLKNSIDRPTDLRGYYKTVNIYSIGNADFHRVIAPELKRLIIAGRTDEYYELAFANAVGRNEIEFRIVGFEGIAWSEIDDQKDLYYAEKLFQ